MDTREVDEQEIRGAKVDLEEAPQKKKKKKRRERERFRKYSDLESDAINKYDISLNTLIIGKAARDSYIQNDIVYIDLYHRVSYT